MLNFNGTLEKLSRRMCPPKETIMTEDICKLKAAQIRVRNIYKCTDYFSI